MTDQPIYAIGDIHGQFEMLGDALERIEADGGPDARVIFLGDLVDRGPDSFRVIEMLQRGKAEGRDWTVILGNHDKMFMRFLENGEVRDKHILADIDWLNPRLGGPATLGSYNVDVSEGTPVRQILADARKRVPQHHIDFLNDLQTSHREPGMIFVHAGVRPNIPLEKQIEDDLIWIREPFLSHKKPFEALIVHGHTALEAPQHYGNRVNLDSGAGYGRPLTTAVIEGDAFYTLDADGRTSLK